MANHKGNSSTLRIILYKIDYGFICYFDKIKFCDKVLLFSYKTPCCFCLAVALSRKGYLSGPYTRACTRVHWLKTSRWVALPECFGPPLFVSCLVFVKIWRVWGKCCFYDDV